MIEVSLFGVLVGTLASGLSLVLLLIALGAAAYLGLTAFTAGLRLGAGRTAGSGAGTSLRALGARWSPRAGALASLVTLGFALVGLRVHDGGVASGWLFTVAVALTGSTAVGAWFGALALTGSRAVALLADRSSERRSRLSGARRVAVRELETKSALYLAGDDLRAEVEQADAALVQLGSALGTLEGIGAGLREKVGGAEGGRPDVALAAEHVALEDDVAHKIEIGRQIKAEAEVAVFRLRCQEPLRRLVRRRPRDATAGLAQAAADQNTLRAAIGRARPAVERFLDDAGRAREALTGIDSLRPSHMDPTSPVDPLARAAREVAAIEAAYTAVLRRVEVVALRLDADAGLRELASAAGALAPSARIANDDENELDQLLSEVSRADAALSVGVPNDLEARDVSEALARGAAALVRNDGRSLDDLMRTMKEIA